MYIPNIEVQAQEAQPCNRSDQNKINIYKYTVKNMHVFIYFNDFQWLSSYVIFNAWITKPIVEAL